MKKTAFMGSLLILSACAGSQEPLTQEVLVEETYTVPCSYSCMQENCADVEIAPMVLKPRVTETYSSQKVRRCCPDDKLNVTSESHTVVPNLPEIYVISANRIANSMLKETEEVLNQKKTPRIYVAETTKTEDDLPGGIEKGTEALKKRLQNASNFIVVDNARRADYIITPEVSWFDTPSKKVPAIKYKLVMNSKDDVKIGEWAEVIHQAQGDRSWW